MNPSLMSGARRFLVLAFAGLFSLAGAQTPARTPSTAPIDASAPIPKTGNAAFFKKHAAILERAKSGPVGLVFLGDSITEGWRPVAPHIWERYFGKYHPANFGIAGDQTQHVVWRLVNGELDHINPKVIVLLIGTNNARRNTGAQIAAANKKIIDLIHAKLPQTKVLLLAIFPRGPRNGPDHKPEDWRKLMSVIDAANADLAKLDDGKTVRFLNINHVFLGPDGQIRAGVMRDQLHPTAAGYQLWVEAIEQPLAEMMK